MLEIDIEKKRAFNCYDDIYTAISKWKNNNYEIMFADSWGFTFNKKSKLINSERGDKEALLFDYHGMELINRGLKEKDNLISIVNKELENNMPIAILGDGFFLP